MLTLIHGDDIVFARKTLSELKDKYNKAEIISFSGNSVNLTDIVSSSDSLSLFGRDKVIILENLLSQSKDKEEILQYIFNSVSIPVILYEEKEIDMTTLTKFFSKAKVFTCKLPQLLFKFLDSIKSSSPRDILAAYQKIIRERQGEFVFSMLIRQWRNLIVAKDLGLSGFSNIPSWQASKFIRQADYFSMKQLISSYRLLLSLDLKVKTGLTSLNLNQLLDIFLVSLYYEV